MGPCPGRHRRVRLVVHLTGSFHQGFSARMQARGGGTPRAVSTDGQLLPYLRRQASTGSSGALLKGEHELGSLGQSRRVGDLVRKALLPS
jgi:hypothetical protein